MFVTSVAKWRGGSRLATAKNNCLLFCKSNAFREKPGFTMIPVAKRLFAGMPARTP